MSRCSGRIHGVAVAMWLSLMLFAAGAQAVTVRVGYRAGVDGLYQALQAEFERRRPGIEIELVPVDGNWTEKLTVMYASGTAPDLFASPGDEIAFFLDAGRLADLTRYFDRSGLRASEFFPIEVDRDKGRPIAVGVYWGPVITAFNKGLFQQSGLGDPGDWSWDEYLASARRLTRDVNSDGKPEVWGTATQLGTWTWHAKVAGWGGRLFDRILYPSRSEIDSPEAVAALQWFADLINVHKVAPPPGTAASFLAGQLAIDEIGPWSLASLGQQIGTSFEWDVAAFPAGPKARAARYAQEILYLWVDSPNKDAAWEFMAFVASDAGQRVVADVQGAMPVRRSTAVTYWAERTDVDRRTFIQAGNYLIRRPYSPVLSQIDGVLNKEFGPVWQGVRPAREAAEAAKVQIDALLR